MKALDSTAAAAQAAALSPSSYHDFAGLQGLKGRARDDGQSEPALRAAAQQFESMFLQEMMRTMRQATIKSDLMESHALDTFEGMFDKEVAMQMAKRGGMGMADMLVQQMKKHVAADAVPDAAGAPGAPATPPTQEPGGAEGATTGALAESSTQSILKSREAVGLPLQRPATPHDLHRKREASGLPLPAPQAYPLGHGPQGIRLKSRDLLE